MKKMATLLAATVGLGTVPQVAFAGEVVKFELLESELSTFEGRQIVLERMKLEAKAACHKPSGPSAYSSAEDCRDDLVTQWIAALERPDMISAVQMEGITLAEIRR